MITCQSKIFSHWESDSLTTTKAWPMGTSSATQDQNKLGEFYRLGNDSDLQNFKVKSPYITSEFPAIFYQKKHKIAKKSS